MARAAALRTPQRLCDSIFQQEQVDLSEPFFGPAGRFDSLPTGESAGNWVLAASLEEFERLQSFSSFYTGNSARKRLETIRDLGFGDAEMDRRLQMLQRRYGPSGR